MSESMPYKPNQGRKIEDKMKNGHIWHVYIVEKNTHIYQNYFIYFSVSTYNVL
jgi:hypothetical protein